VVRAALVLSILAVLPGCTEANPLAQGSTGSSGGDAETSATTSATTSTTSPTTSTQDETSASTDPTTADSSSETTDDTTGSAMCPTDTHVCAVAPAGWQGPAAMIEDTPEDPQPVCDGEPGVVGYAGLAYDDAVCGCDCVVDDATCSDVVLNNDDDLSCNTAPTNSWVLDGCDSSVVGGDDEYWRAISTASGSCSPQATFEAPPATFASRVTACPVADAPMEGCAGAEQCIPIPSAPYQPRLCIWQEDDVECPGDMFTERTLVHRDIDDTRDCTECTCGEVDATCSGSVFLLNTNCPGVAPILNIPLNVTCTLHNTNGLTVSAASVGAIAVEDASCPASTPLAQGDVLPVMPITVCCQP
jgi:hypothetical protein